MDRHCFRQSPYQPTAGQVYLDYLRLEGRDASIDERFRALDLSIRPLSASELEEHHKREICLKQDARYRWAKLEKVRALENRAFTAVHQCRVPPTNANNGLDNVRRQLSERFPQYPQPKCRPPPLDLANGDHRQQQSLGMSYEQRGYLEFEIADQKRRVARMGLGGQQSHEELSTSQETLPYAVPERTNHYFPHTYAPKQNIAQRMREQSKAQQQESKILACGQLAQDRTSDFLLKSRSRQEAEQRKVAQEKRKQQNREQQKVQLPAAMPGNLYPGPTRIAGVPAPVRTVHDNDMKQCMVPELKPSLQFKSRMDSREAHRKYKEEQERKKEDEKYKAALSIPRPEAPRTEVVKQLLASVNKAMENNIVAAEIEAIHVEGVGNEALRTQSQQPHQGLGSASEADVKCGESFWYISDKDEPLPRGIYGHPKGADESAHYTGSFQRKVAIDPFRNIDLRAAVDAIDRTSGDFLESPKTASAHDEPQLLQPSTVPFSPNQATCVADAAGLSLAAHKDPSVKLPRQDVSSRPILQVEQMNMSSDSREGEAIVEDTMEAAPLGEVDIQSEWEEVDDSLGDDGWCEVEQDLVNNVMRVSLNSSDVEWTSDVASEGAVDF